MNIIYDNTETAELSVSFICGVSKELTEFKLSGFEGKKGQTQLIGNVLYIGTEGCKETDDWRELGFKVMSVLRGMKASTARINVPERSKEFIEGVFIGDYSFDKYKSEPKPLTLETVYIGGKRFVETLIKKAKIGTDSQKLVRSWVNTSPEDANSDSIEHAVVASFDTTNVSVTVYGDRELKNFGMEGHLAVNRASRHEAKTIKLVYSPKKATKHITLVGKGLSYDSGGLSLKPATSMTSMKCDKAGAMTVWGIMKAIEKLELNVKVTAYMCLAENMIDGSAYKPDDVLTMMNGKTVHVKNTDAEGRIVLFDNICLAQHENKDIDELYTFATLTGAALAQFGAEACGMVGFNDDMKNRIAKSGEKAGEIYMDAAFHKYMLDGVDDKLADLSNTGTKYMGCQKAGLFLTKALEEGNKDKYLHLDIAGPAWADSAWGTNVSGGTGFAVRTFIEYLTFVAKTSK